MDVSLRLEEKECGGVVVAVHGGGHGGDEKCKEENAGGKGVHFLGSRDRAREV